MKIAISATGSTLTSPVDPRFGRAPYLLIIDTESQSIVQVIDNRDGAEATQGAGIHAAGRIAEAGAAAILTGVVGPKAAAVCAQAGIAMHNGVSGTVAEALQQFLADQAKADAAPAATAERFSPNTQGAGGQCRRQGGGGQGQGQGQGGCGRGRGRGRG